MTICQKSKNLFLTGLSKETLLRDVNVVILKFRGVKCFWLLKMVAIEVIASI